MICFRCGSQNQEGANYCQSCKAMLPKISESISAANPGKVNVHYLMLKEAAEKIQANTISVDEFLATLEDIYGKISERLAEVEAMELEDEVREALDEQIQIGVSGIHLFLEGIEEMRLYVEDSNPQHLSVGVSTIFQGNENLNTALEMARDNIRRLKDMGVDSEISVTDEQVE